MVDLSKFKDLFISEAEDQFQIFNERLLVLEKNIEANDFNENVKIFDELMRASHTLKGSSATMGYNKTAFLAHVMEDVFDGARNGILKITKDLMNILFKSVDILEKSIVSIKVKDSEEDTDAFAKELKEIAGVSTEGVGKSVQGNVQAAESNKEKVETGKDAEAQAADEDAAGVSKIDYIKVPVERLDSLMDLVEELLIDKMRLEQLTGKAPELKDISSHLSFLVSSIQYHVMQARLVPVEQIFARFPRMVRDLSKKQNKEVDFRVVGSELELDRTIVDKLGEPLVHLLRNAVDHGISKKGAVVLKAVRESDYALISVENDDQGIDFEAVRRVAVKKGIASEKDLENYDENRLVNLLFHPHMSTREKVTEISGRGVGLSVVKSFTESLGGRVIVENLNPGARFILELPLTLAIVNSLLVGVDDLIFAIPFSSIDRSVTILSSDIKKMADNEVAVVNGDDVPLVRLSRVFKGRTEEKEETEVTAVLIRRGKNEIGVVVDYLINEQEIIVKPLAPVLRSLKGFSGSTILGDGRTILILDIINLLKTVKYN